MLPADARSGRGGVEGEVESDRPRPFQSRQCQQRPSQKRPSMQPPTLSDAGFSALSTMPILFYFGSLGRGAVLPRFLESKLVKFEPVFRRTIQ